jgi:IS5 family transposase
MGGTGMAEQLSLADALADRRLGSNAKLTKIHDLIDWKRLEPLLAGIRPGQTGRPPYTALRMVKAMYLQALYDLSDPGLEEALLWKPVWRRSIVSLRPRVC